MKRVAMLFCLIVVMALSSVGFGFAKWSSDVSATVESTTALNKLVWVNYSMMQHDHGPDWHAAQGLTGIYLDPEQKNVGTTSGDFTDSDKDGYLDSFNITIDNAYPYYYNEISGKIRNAGSIPLITQAPVIHWMGTDFLVGDTLVYWLGKDGRIIKPTAQQIATPLTVNDNWVLEFRWDEDYGIQLHPGDTIEQSFELQVLQAADQKTTYNLGITLAGVQWNEGR